MFGRRNFLRWHLRSANSASTTSSWHWPSSGDVWVRACSAWLLQSPSYSMHVVVHVGKQSLYKPRDCHQILPSSRIMRQRQNDDLQFCLPCEKCEGWARRERAPVNFLKASFADEETWRRPIPYRRVSHGLGWPADAILFLPIVKGNQKSRNTSAPTASNIAHPTNSTWLPFYPIGHASHDLVTVHDRHGKIAFRELCCKWTWRWLATPRPCETRL